ncbi:MAG TPA: hypothetical protein PLF01_02455 [Alphaproteobacteria bacterium]|nr:hypothetical protein [Alphaproteobacteria bacterium]
MGIVPERSAEDQAAYELSLSRGFCETSDHMVQILKSNADAEQANRDRVLNEGFGEGPIAVALAAAHLKR